MDLYRASNIWRWAINTPSSVTQGHAEIRRNKKMTGQGGLVSGRAGLGRAWTEKDGLHGARAGPGRSIFLLFLEVRRPKSSKSVRLYDLFPRSMEENKLPGLARAGLGRAGAREAGPEPGPGWAGPDRAKPFFADYGQKHLMAHRHTPVSITSSWRSVGMPLVLSLLTQTCSCD